MKPALLVVLFLALDANAAPVPCAAGDWPLWRGTPQHTACQGLPGRINHPVAKKLYPLGGLIQDQQLLVAPAVPGCSEGVLLLAPAGSLVARCASGRELWSRRYVSSATLWGIVDLDDDGLPEFLTTSNQNGMTHLEVFDVATGVSRWTTESAVSGVGDIAIGDVDGDGEPDLLWAPASSSTISAFTFRGGYAAAALLWQTRFVTYVSDPYSPGPIVIDKAIPGKGADVIISGGRHEFDIIVLDGLSGNLKAQRQYFADPTAGRVTEGGGEGQLAALCDVNRDGNSDIVVVSSYPSNASYMFQGAIVASPGSLADALVVDAHPYGWEFVDGSLRNLGSDGPLELVVSKFTFARSRYVTDIVDLSTLATVVSTGDARLQAIIETKIGPIALVQTGNVDESVQVDLPVHAYRIGDSSLEPLDWTLDAGQIITTDRADTRAPDVANRGVGAITVDPEDNGVGQMLLKTKDGNADVMSAIDLMTGRVRARFEPETAIKFVRPIGSGPSRGVVVALDGGTVVVLDSALHVHTRFDVGGFYLSNAGNGHSTAPAIIADLDRDGVNEIYVNDSLGNVVRLNAKDGSSAVILHGPGSPDPVAVGGSLIMRSCAPVPSSLCRYDGAGSLVWNTNLPYDDLPIGANVGHFGPDRQLGIVVAGAPAYPMTTYAVSLEGEILWWADQGPYWDATYAVADFDGDGVDDVVYNYNTDKARVISGVDGHLLSRPVTLPVYRQLNYIDYNGAPIVLNIGPNGSPDVIDVEDNGHVARIRPIVNGDDPHSEIIWSIEQAVLDDERTQMPAAADAGFQVILGCGSNRGVFAARDAKTGSSLWEKTLISPDSTLGTALTKSVAVDVNGDGSIDFIVGGEDGQLRALDAATGRQLWSIDLGSAIGEPVVADIDGDGFSEIVVAASDGWLYEITEGTRRRAVSH